MRELLFRNLTTQNAHKRDLFVSEMVSRGGAVVKTQRRSIYLVKDATKIKSLSELDDFNKKNGSDVSQKRHFYVIKKHNTKTKEDRLYCKVRGFLYVVMGDCVYSIAFTNFFKINIKKKSGK